ncbi:hypothetical protein [Paenarthrobacter sp. PH39-S1]|uniref:hypothetical protein n=1 Tax=Paenarthrobacter sp. PH39-S1 TaxID=3046204 RepID=UPI0024B8FA3E|nr:hypothetical protein [Paenarthrobacter sp. PH39-S1]MDJ0357583.1 hypothetical protein [Paenarthrobacter sp. PH39-S1]
MPEESGIRQDLLDRIEGKRDGVNAYLHRVRPRRNRLTNISIIGSALAAVLTAGPALGGAPFSSGVQHILSLQDDSTVWRVLCLAALVTSVSATIATNLSKSQDISAEVIAAEACNAELEGLRTSLEFGMLPIREAVKLYQQYVAKVPFVEDTPAR